MYYKTTSETFELLLPSCQSDLVRGGLASEEQGEAGEQVYKLRRESQPPAILVKCQKDHRQTGISPLYTLKRYSCFLTYDDCIKKLYPQTLQCIEDIFMLI